MKSEIEKLETAIKPSEKNLLHGGTQLFYDFKNGYSASVTCHAFSYGNESGLLELAVLKNGDLCYDSGITDDVIGFINCEEAKNYISQIKELEPPKIVSEKENISIKLKLR